MTGWNILVLEDDEPTASAYAEGLAAPGTTVVTCNRFDEARRHLLSHCPNALLADVRVGEFNGLHLATLFRSHAPTGQIVIVSGYEDPVIRRHAEGLGAEFFLKPVSLAELVGRLSPPPSE